MFRIHRIEIYGIWGYRDIKTKFYRDVNIFIGINGTGKTTFLNLLEGILSIDLKALSSIQFDKAIILLKDGTSRRKIEVNKEEKAFKENELIYKIGNKSFNVPLVTRRFEFTHGNLPPRYRVVMMKLKQELAELVNLSWLSVHRELAMNFDQSNQRERFENNTIDEKLYDLINKLAFFFLQLETKSNDLSKDFQRQVFETLLFNEKFDFLDINKELLFKPAEIKEKLSHAFKDLKVYNEDISRRIDSHVEMISKAIDKIQKVKEDSNLSLIVNDVTPISLFHRTSSIIDFYSKIVVGKKTIFEPITNYLELLKFFIKNKDFEIDSNNPGELLVFLNRKNGKSELPTKLLSSGEKQLLILLTETILQKEQSTVFIADEPELSLHIEWQKNILSSIKKLNKNAQIIVATHSPEIAGEWQKNIINMEDIIINE